jgi:excisionase family DNA binding protein
VNLTVKQAADALGVSERTVRRWLTDGGGLSSQKVLVGKREVRTLDPAEVARFAQSHGLAMSGHEGTGADVSGGHEGAEADTAEGDVAGLDAASPEEAQARVQRMTDRAGHRRAEADRRDRTELLDRIAELEGERERLWGLVENLTRALPPAAAAPAPEQNKPGRGWWSRMFGRDKGGGTDG